MADIKEGGKKKCYGVLPIEHPRVFFFADRNHRARTYGKAVWALALAPKKTSKCSKLDARRLQRNYAYMIHGNATKSFEELKIAAEAALEHHFDNHSKCGTWCKRKLALASEDHTLKLKTDFKYRDKKKDCELYMQLLEIHTKYTTDECLREVHHPFDTNIVEAINALITRFVPKNLQFGFSLNWKGRVALAIGIHSLGYEKYLSRLYGKLGLTVTKGERKEWKSHDKRVVVQRLYNKNDEVRVRNAQRRYAKMGEELKKLEEDWKSMRTYESGMGGPGGDDEEITETDRCCPYCGGSDHKTKRSVKCKVSTNRKSKYFVDTEKDSEDLVENTI